MVSLGAGSTSSAQQATTAAVAPTTAAPNSVARVSAADAAQSRVLSAEAKELNDNGHREQLQLAGERLLAALQIDPSNVDAHVEVARYIMKAGGNFDAAESMLRKGLSIDPQHGNAHVLLGYVLTQKERFGDAAEEFLAARRYRATSPWLGVNEAELALRKGDVVGALRLYAEIANAASSPKRIRAVAYEAMARELIHQDRFAEARASYEKSLEIVPDDAVSMSNYACLLRKMLDVGNSEKWGRQALRIEDFPEGRACLGKTLYLTWAEALIVQKDEVRAARIFAEAQRYLDSPAALLHEIYLYPRPHPIIEALAAKGYSLDHFEEVPIGTGSSPLTMATGNGKLETVERLLKAGANIDIPGYNGQTALMIATRSKNLPMMKLLLGRKADVYPHSGDGEDAESVARDAGFSEGLTLLMEARQHSPAGATAAYGDLRIGYLYRVKRAPKLDNHYSDTLKVGEVYIMAGPMGLLGSDAKPSTAFEAVQLKDLDKGYYKTWAYPAGARASWSEYFEEIGPASPE